MRLSEAQVDHVLSRWPVARLAMLDGAVQPRVLPVVFARVAGTLWSPVDGKPKGKGRLARVRHVAEHPRVELLLDHYDADWQMLWWVRISGIARIVQPPDPQTDPDVGPALSALREKYPQYVETPVLSSPPTLLAIRNDGPGAIRSWCASEEAARSLTAPDAARQ